ncbi:MAG: PAS domain S-box protein [Syntrophomonadaceae bacterium]
MQHSGLGTDKATVKDELSMLLNFMDASGESLTLFEVSPDKQTSLLDYRLIASNPACIKLLGITGSSLTRKTLREVLPHIDHTIVEQLQEVLIKGSRTNFLYYVRKSRTFLKVSAFLAADHILALLMVDITPIKSAEAEVREQVRFLQHLIDTIPSPVYYKDPRGVYLGCNTAFETCMGVPKEDIVGKRYSDLVPANVAAVNTKMDNILLQNPGIQCYDGVLPFADGSLHDVIYNQATVQDAVGELLGLVGVTVDITQRKKAEEALSVSEEKFRNIFSQSPIGIMLVDTGGVVVDANQASLNIFGVNQINEIVGLNLFETPGLPGYIKQRISNGESVRYEGEFLFPTKQNNPAQNNKSYLDFLITPLKQPKVGFLFQVQDITTKKQAEIALKNSENQLRRITSNMQDVILQINREGVIEYISPSCERILGYSPDAMLNRPLTEYMDPADHHLLQIKDDSKITFRLRNTNDQWIWLEATGSPLWDDNNQKVGIVLGARDISDRKRMEREMARLDRLRLSGEIAASIGHEIRNPLTTVQGFLQILRKEKALAPYQSYFDLMFEELKATNTIVTEFLSLAQDKTIFLRTQDLNALVQNFCPLITAEAMKSDKKVIWSPGNISQVTIDGNEIRQLLLNLSLNGLEAMEPGGELEIKTYMDDDKVVLAIKDQGPGISSEIIDQLGTPFVTTKENGTGLGLAVCYSIAARHRAIIDLDTGPGGCTFKVLFESAQD